jgi:predicted aminopeptidase
MPDRIFGRGWFKRAGLACAGLWLTGALCGCQTTHYYAQAIAGEYEILSRRQPIDRLSTDPQESAKLKEKFELVLQLRAFAQSNLKLPINKHYTSYVDLHRQFAIWNVNAAPEFSLEPKKWWYPFVGRLKYRGYFSEKDAESYGAQLTRKGDDVYVEGIEAYSTLGWFADPLMNTFIIHPESDLAETIFHELTHQRLFLSGDTDFNEAFATAVAEEGVRRWFDARDDRAQYQEYLTDLQRNRQFVALIMKARRQLEVLYGETNQPPKPRPRKRIADPERVRARKAEILEHLRAEYEQLRASWGGYSGYDPWIRRSLNNAQLNTIAVYYELVPGFQVLLHERGGDLEAFYRTVEELRKLSKEDRHRRLQDLASMPGAPPPG